MNPTKTNRSVVGLLRFLSDGNCVEVTQSKHTKVVGRFDGIRRVFVLSVSPSGNYEGSIKSRLRRFISELNIDEDKRLIINKKYFQLFKS